jgi:hypothetical protein
MSDPNTEQDFSAVHLEDQHERTLAPDFTESKSPQGALGALTWILPILVGLALAVVMVVVKSGCKPVCLQGTCVTIYVPDTIKNHEPKCLTDDSSA